MSYIRIHVFKFNPTTGKSVSKAIINISVSISLNLPLGQGFQLADPSPYSFVSRSVTVKYLQQLILLLLLRTFNFAIYSLVSNCVSYNQLLNFFQF